MPFELVSRGARRAYEEWKLSNPGNNIASLLFPTVDEDTNAAFLLDTFVSSPYGVAYREPGSQSVVRAFEQGSGQLITPPTASEKTAIGQELKDLIISGGEPTEAFMTRFNRIVSRIQGIHTEGHNMTKFKQAIDVMRTGKFEANGVAGKDLDLDIDYNRDAANSLTYDFTDTGATFSEALKNLEVQANKQGTPKSNRVMIIGNSWANAMLEDEHMQKYMQNNPSNNLIASNMMPALLQNTQGLTVLTQYRAPNMLAPVYICTYDPDTQYVAYKGATPAPWIPDTEAIFFSLADKRYSINRGIDAFDGNGKVVRVTGDIVIDTFSNPDPIEEYLRSQSRHAFVPANINHTFKSTGTFA